MSALWLGVLLQKPRGVFTITQGRTMLVFQFVTRAVRVVDLITNLDMVGFNTHSGLTAFINRLEVRHDLFES